MTSSLLRPAISTVGLAKSYGTNDVLAGIDLEIARGSVFALLGPNGAGKTTTIRILATLTQPSTGTALVAGFDAVTQRREVRRRISLTGQYAAIDELQTGRENLQMMARLRHVPARAARARAAELLDAFDLTAAADRRVATYSGGMRRRLDIAAGLVTDPEVIFLDEPTTGLDPRSRQAMWDVVAGLAATGVTVFLTTQYLEEADRLAGHIAVLDGGRIVAQGTASELKRQASGQRLDIQLADRQAFAEAQVCLGSRAVHLDRAALTIGIATDGAAADVRALLDEVDPARSSVTAFAVHAASLDDVFLSLTSRANREKEPAHV
jgi:ABC-2 type transport system ATP-binding protein